jgi:hypothetical protein
LLLDVVSDIAVGVELLFGVASDIAAVGVLYGRSFAFCEPLQRLASLQASMTLDHQISFYTEN